MYQFHFLPIKSSLRVIFQAPDKDLEGDTASDLRGYGKRKVKSLHQPE